MTREELIIKLKYYITCLKCKVDGNECDDSCVIQYEAGNMGEIIKNLEAILKCLEQDKSRDPLKIMVKTCLNSIYGKFATNDNKRKDVNRHLVEWLEQLLKLKSGKP